MQLSLDVKEIQCKHILSTIKTRLQRVLSYKN